MKTESVSFLNGTSSGRRGGIDLHLPRICLAVGAGSGGLQAALPRAGGSKEKTSAWTPKPHHIGLYITAVSERSFTGEDEEGVYRVI